MSTEVTTTLPFEIGHVLFIDLVGYSKLLIAETIGCRGSVLECAGALALLVVRARGGQPPKRRSAAALQNASVTQRLPCRGHEWRKNVWLLTNYLKSFDHEPACGVVLNFKGAKLEGERIVS
jgi:hypothetical protein